jgi:hypothetical protein
MKQDRRKTKADGPVMGDKVSEGPPDGDVGGSPQTKAYEEDPSIENYVRLRRANPSANIEVKSVGGPQRAELQKLGLSPLLVSFALQGRVAEVGDLSFQLLERMIDANARRKAGERALARNGLAIPDRLINSLVVGMLENFASTDGPQIPNDLFVLIREMLGGAGALYQKAEKAREGRWDAILLGGQMMARGETPTLRGVGRVLGVAATTVSRWFPKDDFFVEAKKMSGAFDEHGSVRPPPPAPKTLLRKK